MGNTRRTFSMLLGILLGALIPIFSFVLIFPNLLPIYTGLKDKRMDAGMDGWKALILKERQCDIWKGLACHTPTTALAIRMSKMTKGSTNAVIWSSDSSNHASTCNMHATRFCHPHQSTIKVLAKLAMLSNFRYNLCFIWFHVYAHECLV